MTHGAECGGSNTSKIGSTKMKDNGRTFGITEEYCNARMDGVAYKLDALAVLMRREFDLLSDDRERQRHDLSDRLRGMNHLREEFTQRLGAIEKMMWRALSVLLAIVLAIQIIGLVIIKGVLR